MFINIRQFLSSLICTSIVSKRVYHYGVSIFKFELPIERVSILHHKESVNKCDSEIWRQVVLEVWSKM